MATVLPAWKLELIEKKRRKEEEERKRAQEEYARNTAIPEWKRSLINRKKTSTEDSPPKKESSPSNSIVSQRKSSFSNFSNDGNSDDKSGISTYRSTRDVTSQECDEKSAIKGGGTEKIRRRDSGQAKDTTAINNIFDFSNSIENSDDLTSDSRNVAYEHVRRPSLVRLMFENVAVTKSDGKIAGDRHKHVSSSSPREAKSPSPGASIDTSPRLVSTQDTSEQSRGLKPEHRLIPKAKVDAQNNSRGGQHDAERSSPSALHPGRIEDEMSHATSVKSLRSIFGGARQSEKTVSVDDLPKVAGHMARPPPPMKRWSANVHNMLSSQSTEDLTLVNPPLHQRNRSVSLTDIREEHSEEHFKHKHNVASGLEKRLNKLIRQVSLSEGEMVVKDGESPSSEEESLTEDPETFTDEAEDLHHTDEHRYKNGPNTEQAAFPEKRTPLPGYPRDAGLDIQRAEKSDDADSGIDASKDEEEKVAKRTRGSVHKLSALFGASIWNGMKKDETKPDLKGGHVNRSVDQHKSSGKGMGVGSKSDEEEQLQGGLSISIPWLKNKTNQKTESGVPKSKIQPQRVELISHSAGHAEPQQGANKNLFNQKYKDTLERGKSADVTRSEANNERTNFTLHHNVPNESKSRAAGNKTVPVENAAVPISAIDMPEPEKDDVSVSVIDEPYPGVNVSVIDYPVMHNGLGGLDIPPESGYLMSDELSDDDSDEDMEGSYTVTSMDGEEELDEDEDEIPVSCIDDTPPPTIIVVFETAPENVRSCMRPKNWKNKGNISFKESVVIHDYPSEDCLAAVYDEMDGRTIQNYQPASLTNIEQKIQQLRQQKKPSDKPIESLADTAPDRPKITYADDGQAFTDSSDSAGALLF